MSLNWNGIRVNTETSHFKIKPPYMREESKKCKIFKQHAKEKTTIKPNSIMFIEINLPEENIMIPINSVVMVEDFKDTLLTARGVFDCNTIPNKIMLANITVYNVTVEKNETIAKGKILRDTKII